MGFEKGNKLGTGRPKGMKNERTEKINALIDKIIDSCENELLNDLEAIEPKERLDIFLKLIEYKIPKLQRTTIGGDAESEPIHLTIDFKNATDADLERIIEKGFGEADNQGSAQDIIS